MEVFEITCPLSVGVSTTGATGAADAVAAILPRHHKCRVVSRDGGSLPRRIPTPSQHVIFYRAGDPCSEADLSFGQEREIDGVGRADEQLSC